jgi:2-polyprenyl-6-hydroxyphenyl methylase/3-demethylubiquinone-9 3-methyltransferase
MVVSSTVRRRPCVNSARRQARLLYASLSSLSSLSPTSLSSIDYHVNNNENNNNSSNADPNEVNKFSSFASSWWDARSNPLVGMNPIRIQFIREVLLSNSISLDDERMTPPSSSRSQQQEQRTLLPLLHGKTCLDIGCGGGLLTESLSRLGASLVIGLDASSPVVEAAKAHSSSSLFHHYGHAGRSKMIDGGDGKGGRTRLFYIDGMTVEEFASRWPNLIMDKDDSQQSSSSLPSSSSSSSFDIPSNKHNHDDEGDENKFDIITALEVIEHVPNPTSLLQAASTLLKPNGTLFISTINRTIKSYALAILAAEYVTQKVPRGTHSWTQFRSPDEVCRMLMMTETEATSMKPIRISGMVLKPPYFNMNWSLNYVDVDINWIGAYQKKIK